MASCNICDGSLDDYDFIHLNWKFVNVQTDELKTQCFSIITGKCHGYLDRNSHDILFLQFRK